jgi:hypothetical protein
MGNRSMKFEDIYYDEITQESFKEMLEICNWLNKTRGYFPIIIGGWAVYLHHPTLGSRDIDILFPNRTLKHYVVNEYLYSHGYKSEGLFEKEFFKEIITPKRKERILIDACSIEDINRLKGTDIIIPWDLALKYQTKKKIENFELYIPQVEILLLYKVKAAYDRKYDLKTTFDPFYLQQKIIKDNIDIITLISYCEIDFTLLKRLLAKYNFTDYFKLVLEEIGNNKEMKAKLGAIKQKLNKVIKKL